MAIQVGCSRGCGTTITVEDEQIQEFIDLKQPIVVAHEVCPNEAAQKELELRSFHITVSVSEVVQESEDDYEETQLASFGGDYRAVTFKEALPGLAKELDRQWQQIAALSQVIDGS